MIKVLLIDDHTLVRQGLRSLFNGTSARRIPVLKVFGWRESFDPRWLFWI